ncbi:DUF4352 domain-containing protein [Agrococcus jejuensis]|uniref:DUF4352 domain-containing protein n=1 Tax=Agrococcus jejuensis TaxID=399736 RepID=UPI0016434E3D|nr:DUF4352 domain-containing protein [Agrococcus jejuensis]
MQQFAPTPQAPRRVDGMALASGIVAGVALLSSFTHVTAFLTWIPAGIAIVLAVIALVKRAQPRWLPITAIVVAPLAWLIAIVVAVSGIALLASGASEAAPTVAAPTSQEPEPVAVAESSPSQEPVADVTPEPTPTQQPVAEPAPVVEDDGTGFVGETLTNEDNISFTVTGARCGIPYVGDQYFGDAALGQFCEVTGTIANWSDDAIYLYGGDFAGQIAGAEYEASSQTLIAGSRFGMDVNPGLTVDVVLYYDVPATTNLEHVSYSDSWSFFTSELRFWVG